MIKATTLIAAAFALSTQAAMAGPVTVSGTHEKTSGKSEKSLVSSVMEQLKFSMSAMRGTVGGSTGKSTEYKSTASTQCDEAKKSADEEEETAKTKKAELVGPEPIYFGF